MYIGAYDVVNLNVLGVDQHCGVTQDLSCAASQTFASWNQIAGWLRRLEALERAG